MAHTKLLLYSRPNTHTYQKKTRYWYKIPSPQLVSIIHNRLCLHPLLIHIKLFKLFALASLASVTVAQLLFPTGYFFITSVTSDLVLDVRGNSKKAGADVIVYGRKSSGYDNQLWKYDQGYLVNKGSGLVLEVPGYENGGPITPGTALKQAEKRGLPTNVNQLWVYEDLQKRLFPYDATVCVTAKNGSFVPGNNAVVDRRDLTDKKQEWKFDAAPAS